MAVESRDLGGGWAVWIESADRNAGETEPRGDPRPHRADVLARGRVVSSFRLRQGYDDELNLSSVTKMAGALDEIIRMAVVA